LEPHVFTRYSHTFWDTKKAYTCFRKGYLIVYNCNFAKYNGVLYILTTILGFLLVILFRVLWCTYCAPIFAGMCKRVPCEHIWFQSQPEDDSLKSKHVAINKPVIFARYVNPVIKFLPHTCVCGRNLITGLTSAASPRVDILSTCKVRQKLGVSLPLLTCSPLA